MYQKRRLLGLTLALAYGLIAMAGQGLHALLPCDDAQCGQSVAACSCLFCEYDAAKAAENTDQTTPGFGTPQGDAHQANDCAICCVLAKIKVGHFGLTAETSLSTVASTLSASPSQPAPTGLLLDYAPRGPPALTVA